MTQQNRAGRRTPKGSPVQEIVIHFTRSAHAATVYADGAWGSVTNQGNIHMALFSEYATLPTIATVDVDTETKRVRGPEKPSGARPSVTREVLVDIILSPAVAIAIRKWLDEQIRAAEEARRLTGLDIGNQYSIATEQLL